MPTLRPNAPPRPHGGVAAALLLACVLAAEVPAQSTTPAKAEAPYVPTPTSIVDRIRGYGDTPESIKVAVRIHDPVDP